MKEPYERPDVKPERINMTEESNKHQGLGRGLSALLGKDTEDFAKPEGGNSIREISVEQLRPSRYIFVSPPSRSSRAWPPTQNSAGPSALEIKLHSLDPNIHF